MNTEQIKKWNEDRPRRHKEFEALVKPLMKFLNDNYSPYTSIVITPSNTEVSQVNVLVRTEVCKAILKLNIEC